MINFSCSYFSYFYHFSLLDHKHFCRLKSSIVLKNTILTSVYTGYLYNIIFLYFSEKQNFLTLYLLTYLIPSKRIGKRKKNDDGESDEPRRLSLEERRETFIVKVQTASDIEPKLNAIKEDLRIKKKTF